MNEVLRCPKTEKISAVNDCLKCNCLFQINTMTKRVECEIDTQRHLTKIANQDDVDEI